MLPSLAQHIAGQDLTDMGVMLTQAVKRSVADMVHLLCHEPGRFDRRRAFSLCGVDKVWPWHTWAHLRLDFGLGTYMILRTRMRNPQPLCCPTCAMCSEKNSGMWVACVPND